MGTSLEKFNNIVSRALQIQGEVLDALSPESVPAWDSFNALMLISELEQGFSAKFSLNDVTAIKTIGDIKTVLRTKGVDV